MDLGIVASIMDLILHVPYGETSMIPVGKPIYISVNVANKIRESFVFQVS